MLRGIRRILLVSVLVVGASSGCREAVPPTAPDAEMTMFDGGGPVGPSFVGQWRRTGYAVTGSATLVIENTNARLTFSSDFSIGQAPGPAVYLNTTNNPNTGQPLRVGALKSRNGAQTYDFVVPAGTRYAFVIIWCDPFNVAMAEAAIQPAP